MLSQVVDVDRYLCTGNQDLKLVVIKESQPVDVDDIVETGTKRIAVRTNLSEKHDCVSRQLCQ